MFEKLSTYMKCNECEYETKLYVMNLYVIVAACNQMQFGVHAVFGPSDPMLGTHIHSICDALDIPHLEARLDLDTDVKEFSINLYPAQHLLNNAFQDVMTFLNWTKVAIIYEEDYGKKTVLGSCPV